MVQVKEIILRLIAFRRDIFVQFCIISVKNVTLNGLKEIRSVWCISSILLWLGINFINILISFQGALSELLPFKRR